MMGAGKYSTSSSRLIPRVFTSSLEKSLPVKNFVNWSNPNHGLSHMPRKGLYSLKAITRPPMGTYRNRMKYNAPGSRRKYSHLC